MADVIQFHCPACCITLKVPLQAAGQRGPCPHCQQMILAPNPYTGVAACRLAEESPEPIHLPPVRVLEPPAPRFEPFQGVPAAPREPVILPQPVPTEKSQPAAWPAALGIGVMAAFLGFAGGYQSARTFEKLPAPVAPTAPTTPPVVATPETPSAPVLKVVQAKPPFPVLTAPRSILDEFLAAPDWKTRSKFVIRPDETAPRMERYHQTHQDAATTVTRMTVEHCEANATTNLMLVVFRIYTPQCPTGFTVAVTETSEGWKVDWEPFVEFKDELFIEFVTGKSGDAGRFHLILLPSTSPSSAEDKITYILSDPVKGREFLATVKKDTDTARTLESITKDGLIATPVLDLSRRAKPDCSFDLEIVGAPATNWRPNTK